MENVMAIDIGTGYAKAAIFYEGLQEPEYLINEDLPMGMKSVVYVSADGSIDLKRKNPKSAAVPEIKMRLSEKSISVPVGNKCIEVESCKIYGTIARELIMHANRMLVRKNRAPVYKVVVTFPAAFVHSDDPKLTTKGVETIRDSIQDLVIDGNKIEIVRMIPEPVAAAYDAICYERKVKDKPITDKNYNIAVVDIGHGTFDVAVVASTNEKDCPFDVVAQDGDKEIGGRIFDKKIVNELAERLSHTDGLKLTAADAEVLYRDIAIPIKHALSDAEDAHGDFFPKGADGYVHIRMTRQEFEALIQTDLNTAFEKTVRTIENAMNKGVQINEIVLTGGSGRIPAMCRMLQTVFEGKNINVRVYRPERAVVYGAARYAFDIEKEPVTQHAEYSYGVFDDETSRVKFLIHSADIIPERSAAYEMIPDFCSTTIRVCRSKSTLCTAKDQSYRECDEIWRFRFDTEVNQPHRFVINLDEAHMVTVECEDHNGNKVVKNKHDD